MKFSDNDGVTQPQLAIGQINIRSAWTKTGLRLGLVVIVSVFVGLAVIISTYHVANVKLLIGLVGGLAFVFFIMRWPEFGILSLVALVSGLISLSWLPLLHLGPISLNISDAILFLLLAFVFLRATTQPDFKLYGSPLILPLFLFIGAFILSAANAILIYGVGFNTVLRTLRVLILWIVFIPTLQLVRAEQALRRLLLGLLILTVVLLVGVLFPNRFSPLLPVEETAYGTGTQTYTGFTRIYYAGDMVLYAMIPVTVASLAMIKKGNQLWRIGLLGLLLFWAFRTGFRQYWLTLFIVCLLLWVFLSSSERMRLLRRMVPALVVSLLLFGTLIAAQPTQVERVVYILTDRVGSLLKNPLKREASLQWRVIETRYALIQINRHPVFGIGLGNSYRPPMESEAGGTTFTDWTNKYIENGYLYIVLMMGLVGLIPFLWLCIAYLLRVFRNQHKIRDNDLRAVFLGFGASFLGMVACNIASPTFVIGTRLIFFPLAMAINEIILRLEKDEGAHI